MLGFHPLRLAHIGLAGDDVVPPDIATGNHGAGSARTLENDHGLYGLATTQCNPFVDRRLERNLLPATALLIRGYHGNGTGIIDPVADGLRREATEHHRMDGADAGAGLHGNDTFDTHGSVSRRVRS